MDVPNKLKERAEALGFRFETDVVVNFAHPRGEEVTVLVTPWGRDPCFNLGTVESFISGCEAGAKQG